MRMKVTTIQKILALQSHSSIYNYIHEVEHYLNNANNFKEFIEKYKKIRVEYDEFIKSKTSDQ